MADVRTISVGDMTVKLSGEGFPLVFVHGFTTTSEFWREQIEEFSRDYFVIRPNLAGHGVSRRPTARQYTIDAFVRDLGQIFAHLDISSAALVGLSMGGTIAQQFALKNPDRLEALVLVGATPHGLGPDVKAENVLNAIAAVGVEAASRNVIENSFGSAASSALVEWAKREVVQTPDFVARAAIASLNESDSRASLKDIVTPTLVVVGDEDVITPPAESRALARGIPGSELAIIEKAGHFPMLEQPAMFNRLLREFLAKETAGKSGEKSNVPVSLV